MCCNTRFGWIVAILLALGAPAAVNAGVMLGGTRVVFNEKDREASISVKNTAASPYLVQAWVDAGEGRNTTPLMVTPPMSRLNPGAENILRVLRLTGQLPDDRESLFWLNVKEIPEMPDEANTLQIAVRSRIKVFYRPIKLPGKSWEAYEQLKWLVAPDPQGQGVVLRIANPTPYHVIFTGMSVNGDAEQVKADTAPPFGEVAYPLGAVKTPQAVKVTFQTINDYGGETPLVSVTAPVGTEPVAVKPERMPAPSSSADGARR